ncbi:MAG: hypothetical protein ACR2HY_02010 [Acidimicrobiales bacterium]
MAVVHPATTQVRSRSSRAERWAAVTLRPAWATATTSTPLVTRAFNTASAAHARAVATGIGPTPGTSHTSPAWVWPRSRAAWSIRTCTMARGPELPLLSAPGAPAASAMATRASAA